MLNDVMAPPFKRYPRKWKFYITRFTLTVFFSNFLFNKNHKNQQA